MGKGGGRAELGCVGGKGGGQGRVEGRCVTGKGEGGGGGGGGEGDGSVRGLVLFVKGCTRFFVWLFIFFYLYIFFGLGLLGLLGVTERAIRDRR